MNKRVRWFLLSPLARPTLLRLVEGMRNEEFSEDSTSGFIIEMARTQFVEARYVERFERVEQVVDPFGGDQEFHVTEYHQTSFRISIEPPQLEIYDGPRSVSPTLNRITALLGLECTVQPVNADITKWMRCLQPELDDIRVTTAYISRLSLSDSVSAKIVIKGTEDVRKYAKEMVSGKPFHFERLEVSANYQEENVRFVLRETGGATIIKGTDDIIPILRSALLESNEKRTA